MTDPWIVIPGWDKFQHYGNRRDASWIKVYNELNSRDEWLELSVAERGLLVTCWIEYSRSAGVLRRSKVQSLCGGTTREKHWEALNHAGFIQLSASKPLALRALAREEKRKSKKPPYPPPERGVINNTQNPRPADRMLEDLIPPDPDRVEKIRELASRIGKDM